MASGRPCVALTGASFRPYTTSNPITAVGSTVPRYCTNFGGVFPLREDEKRQEPRDHRTEHDHADHDNLLRQGHACSPLSSRLRPSVKLSTINAIAGIMKLCPPKASRHAAEQPTPMSAGL